MANNYEAIVRAVLDQRQFDSDMEALENAKYELRNIHIQPSNLTKEIQNALNSATFNVDIKLGKMGNVDAQAQKVGASAANSISKVINSQLSKLKFGFDSNSIQGMSNTLKSIGFDDGSISKITKDLNEMNLAIDKITAKQAGGNLDISVKGVNELGDAVSVIKRLNLETQEVTTKSETLARSFQNTGKTISSLDVITLDNKMKTWLEKNTKASKDFGTAIESLRARLKAAYEAGEITEEVFNKVDTEFKEIQQSAIAAGKAGKSFGTSLKNAFKGLIGVVSVGTVFSKTVETLKEMYQAVYDIDTAMVSLMKVTDETSSRYNTFLKDAAASAKELGRSVSSLVEQSATWAKLGYTLDQSEELAKLSSIYANVAEVDDATAVSDMVTAMKAFNIEAERAVTVIDPLNELGNNFATDAAALGEGLSKSASAMNAAGTDMYKTLAMLTGGAEITQSAGEFGNFLKTASMRIRGMKGELEELGEEVDESVDSISKVQTQILNLTHGKVNIFDDMGAFRDYYEIMEDIAEVFNELSSIEQASLSEILFGKMRGNQGQALIQAFQSGQIQKAYETALNSAGSAAAEQEKWMESLEAKTQQFQAAWQELSMTVLNSDFLKGLVDTGTTLLEILTKIVDTIGVLGTVATGSGIFAFFKSLDWAETHTFFLNLK